AFSDGLLAAINSDKMRYARDMLLGHRPARDDIPCTTCEIYLGMRRRGRWLQRAVGLKARLRGLYHFLLWQALRSLAASRARALPDPLCPHSRLITTKRCVIHFLSPPGLGVSGPRKSAHARSA